MSEAELVQFPEEINHILNKISETVTKLRSLKPRFVVTL